MFRALNMETLLLQTLFASLFGIAVGSFINVVVFRSETNETLLGRSKCRTCQKPILPKDLIPVLSYFALKGRCRSCSAVIEWQYPVVEIVMGVLFGVLYARAAMFYNVPSFVESNEWMLLFLRDAVMSVFLLIIFVYDLRFSYILDRFSIPAMIIALGCNALLGAPMVSILLGGLMIGGFFAFQFLISKGAWIGGGDIRMGLLMGFYLGISQGLLALFIAYVLGSIVGVILILSRKRKLDSQVPFGTFLSAATLVALLFGNDILGWYLGLLH